MASVGRARSVTWPPKRSTVCPIHSLRKSGCRQSRPCRGTFTQPLALHATRHRIGSGPALGTRGGDQVDGLILIGGAEIDLNRAKLVSGRSRIVGKCSVPDETVPVSNNIDRVT